MSEKTYLTIGRILYENEDALYVGNDIEMALDRAKNADEIYEVIEVFIWQEGVEIGRYEQNSKGDFELWMY